VEVVLPKKQQIKFSDEDFVTITPFKKEPGGS